METLLNNLQQLKDNKIQALKINNKEDMLKYLKDEYQLIMKINNLYESLNIEDDEIDGYFGALDINNDNCIYDLEQRNANLSYTKELLEIDIDTINEIIEELKEME